MKHSTAQQSAQARVVAISDTDSVAFSNHVSLEVVMLYESEKYAEETKVVAVPGSPEYALGLIHWQNRWIPMLDLSSMVYHTAAKLKQFAFIVGYRHAQTGVDSAEVQYGAITTDVLPQTVTVTDDMVANLPNNSAVWSNIALSCISHQDKPVPILSADKLFSYQSLQ